MSSISRTPNIEPGTYEHYKGNVYNVFGIGRHTEQDDYFVVYSPVEQKEGMPSMWLRPYKMFVETVEVAGKVKPRFERVGDAVESHVLY